MALGQWVFGSPDFLKLSLFFQLDLSLQNPGLDENAWENSLESLKSQITEVKSCKTFAAEFNNIWEDWNTHNLERPNIEFTLSQLERERSLFSLSEILFHFLWLVKGEESLFSDRFQSLGSRIYFIFSISND